MAHKKLLTETEIRRFMKLATIGRVGDTKIQEMGYTHPGGSIEEQEEEDPMAMGDEMGDLPPEEGAPEEMDMDIEDEPVGGEEDLGGMEMGEREELLAQVVGAVAEVLGVEADVEGAEGEEEDIDMDMGDEEDIDMEMGAEEGGEEVPAELEGEEELPAGRDMGAYQESIVNEVSKRVAARLVKADRREKMAEQLTERIFARLTKK